MFRAGMVVVALAMAAGAVEAQVTTYIAPPRAKAPTPQMVALADSVRRDSVAQVAMTNMKAWVDSAAGVTVPDRVGVDSAPLVNDPGRPETTPARPESSTTFSDGSVAPATASALPAILLLGVVALGGGVLLLTHRSRG